MARKNVRAKDLKNQRWAAIVAAVLALGMIISLLGVYIGQTLSGREAVSPEQQQTEPQPEDYLAHYSDEVERLELYLAENEPTVPLLLELAENYRYLVFVQEVFFDDPEAVEQSREKLSSVFSTLVQLDPDNTEYRLQLINLYIEMGKEDEQIEPEVDKLLELLSEEPNIMVHLSLLNLLESLNYEERLLEEIQWLYEYLEPLYTEGLASSEESFYYAVLLGEYMGDRNMAVSILNEIMLNEHEDSDIYQDALGYLDYLENEDVINGEPEAE